MPKTKYLIETSAVPAALGESTPFHCRHFQDEVGDGTCWTSIYIRMEFVRRWIRHYIRMAFETDHYQDLSTALYHLEQDFGARGVKATGHAIAALLQQQGKIEDTRTAAKELGRLAVGQLRKFDRRFQRRTPNSCGCKIGDKELKVDFNHLFEDLKEFMSSVDTVRDCPINAFLGFRRDGNADRLLDNPEVREKTKSGKRLAELNERGKWITCRECATIGDVVIVLDQPPSCCLVHIDEDFNILCDATNRQHKPIRSQRAIERGTRHPQ
ncbi:MAG: hypothetical protein ACYTG0_02910 [Planctomycetota bacterium]|jgi:hypothetical protein